MTKYKNKLLSILLAITMCVFGFFSFGKVTAKAQTNAGDTTIEGTPIEQLFPNFVVDSLNHLSSNFGISNANGLIIFLDSQIIEYPVIESIASYFNITTSNYDEMYSQLRENGIELFLHTGGQTFQHLTASSYTVCDFSQQEVFDQFCLWASNAYICGMGIIAINSDYIDFFIELNDWEQHPQAIIPVYAILRNFGTEPLPDFVYLYNIGSRTFTPAPIWD